MIRLIVALVLAGHGIGHSMGFMAAWMPSVSPFQDKPWVLSDSLTMGTAMGKVLGVLWLLPLAGFLTGAYGLWQETSWWRPMLIGAAAVSLALVLPWWSAMPRGSYIGALTVNIAVLVALLFWDVDA